MKDLSAEYALDEFLSHFCSGSPEELGEGFHAGAAIFGFEDGLFVQANRTSYLNFARHMRNVQPVRRSVEWRKLQGRIALACISETNGPNKKTSFLTLMCFGGTWQIVTQTFHAENEGAL